MRSAKYYIDLISSLELEIEQLYTKYVDLENSYDSEIQRVLDIFISYGGVIPFKIDNYAVIISESGIATTFLSNDSFSDSYYTLSKRGNSYYIAGSGIRIDRKITYNDLFDVIFIDDYDKFGKYLLAPIIRNYVYEDNIEMASYLSNIQYLRKKHILKLDVLEKKIRKSGNRIILCKKSLRIASDIEHSLYIGSILDNGNVLSFNVDDIEISNITTIKRIDDKKPLSISVKVNKDKYDYAICKYSIIVSNGLFVNTKTGQCKSKGIISNSQMYNILKNYDSI